MKYTSSHPRRLTDTQARPAGNGPTGSRPQPGTEFESAVPATPSRLEGLSPEGRAALEERDRRELRTAMMRFADRYSYFDLDVIHSVIQAEAERCQSCGQVLTKEERGWGTRECGVCLIDVSSKRIDQYVEARP